MIRGLTNGMLPTVLMFALMLVSLYLLGLATEKSEGLGDLRETQNLYEWMLLVNTVGLLVLLFLITSNLSKLVRSYRQREAGSRLNLRMVIVFVVLAVVPVTVVYAFSLQFLQRSIDTWFKVRVEQALEDALDLSRSALDLRKREILRRTEEMAKVLSNTPMDDVALTLDDIRDSNEASELSLLGNNRIIAFSSLETTVVPHQPGDDVMVQIRKGGSYINLEAIPGSGLFVRVAVEVPIGESESELKILQALFPIAQHLNTLADSVQSHFSQYKTLAYQREPLKRNFSLTLSMVLLFSLLAAVWAAFFTTRRLVAPIRELAEGTRAVAEGDYDKRLPATGQDELGFLVRSFNEMTRRVGKASADARLSQLQAEEQRTYLQAVLANLSSGVITLDQDHLLRTVNEAAGQILAVDLEAHRGNPFVQLGASHSHLKRFVETLTPLMDSDSWQWSQEVILFHGGGRQVLMCRGTTLKSDEGEHGDHIVVFDDITALMQAQRDAAWAEVARRLAHEIKNPLTPIQLSAERMRRKYLDKMDADDAKLLDRSTHTIVQQVEAMKEMVNAFSDYARAPQIKLTRVDLNKLVYEVLDLYPSLNAHFDHDNHDPQIEADPGRLRQVLHNLIKNALEAMEGQKNPRLELSTRCMDEFGCQFVEFKVRDFGGGFDQEAPGQYFEPYVTSKSKGTGLGLAIVKKIVEEHGGMVWAENVKPSGACVFIRLPVYTAVPEAEEMK